MKTATLYLFSFRIRSKNKIRGKKAILQQPLILREKLKDWIKNEFASRIFLFLLECDWERVLIDPICVPKQLHLFKVVPAQRCAGAGLLAIFSLSQLKNRGWFVVFSQRPSTFLPMLAVLLWQIFTENRSFQCIKNFGLIRRGLMENVSLNIT